MTALHTTPAPRLLPSPDPLPAGIAEEPAAEAVLRLLLETLAAAGEIVPHGNGFALVVEITPDLLDMLAIAGAAAAEGEDGDASETSDEAEDDDPAEDADPAGGASDDEGEPQAYCELTPDGSGGWAIAPVYGWARRRRARS